MSLVHIPPGEFVMGSPETEVGHTAEETPRHTVRILSGFYLGCYEVSVAEYCKIIDSPSLQAATADQTGSRKPIGGISWVEANEFCNRLSALPDEAKSRRRYRLPTEAEWEYVCRAGTETAYSSGEKLLSTQASFLDSSSEGRKPEGATRVGSFQPNQFGVFDMHGNVWEWCADWFSAGYYSSSPVESPRGPETGDLRSIRGGSWRTGPNLCRSAFRDGNDPTARREDYGFRVICVMEEGIPQFPDSSVQSGYAATSGKQSESATTSSNVDLFANLIEKIEPSVVRINTAGPRGIGCGSGFLVDTQGVVLTNYHVIEGATRARAVFNDGYEVEVSGYLALRPERDLAVLKLARIPSNREPITFATDLPRKGERVMAFGAPLGLSFTASDGIVSAIRSAKEMAKQSPSLDLQVTWIQTTTPISPGNSGGPLINTDGKVIGINTITNRAGQNINFAVSAIDAKEVVNGTNGMTVQKLSPRATSLADLIRQLESIKSD